MEAPAVGGVRLLFLDKNNHDLLIVIVVNWAFFSDHYVVVCVCCACRIGLSVLLILLSELQRMSYMCQAYNMGVQVFRPNIRGVGLLVRASSCRMLVPGSNLELKPRSIRYHPATVARDRVPAGATIHEAASCLLGTLAF